ncbi:MAG TPA: GNAT family N-acetyltransferase [Caulobacteraceae bacterium]|jgi:N-acetylglutamate synthase-like GNAT family acetyltransferase|nr:GNAT family N-acetyltransferase [Caulobacteraceae bacterium]
MAEIQLRQATAADVAAIRSLTRAAYAKWVPLIGREPGPMTADYEAAILTHRFDLLERDGRLAALIETVDEGDQLLIENIAVAPVSQGQGLGHVLLAHAERLAADLGRPRLRLFTNSRFAENIRLYRSVGYAIDREEDLGFAIRVHMSKRVGD